MTTTLQRVSDTVLRPELGPDGHAALVLVRDGAPVPISSLPPSLRALAHSNIRAVASIDDQIQEKETRIGDLVRREDAARRAGLPTRGIRATMTRLAGEIQDLQRLREPFVHGYLEMPARQNAAPLNVAGTEDERTGAWGAWGVNLGLDVPVDVLEDLAAAREAGVFDVFWLYRAEGKLVDPHVVGVVTSRYWRPMGQFLIAAWR